VTRSVQSPLHRCMRQRHSAPANVRRTISAGNTDQEPVFVAPAA
jgi:hypothetical protein